MGRLTELVKDENCLQAFIVCYLRCLNVQEAEKESGFSLLSKYPVVGFYVYALIDPRNWAIFYIGKGIGGRVLKHEERTRRGVIQNKKKVEKIQEIFMAGLDVQKRILFVSDSEETALAMEDHFIHALRNSGLTNIVGKNSIQCASVVKMADTLNAELEKFRQNFNAF